MSDSDKRRAALFALECYGELVELEIRSAEVLEELASAYRSLRFLSAEGLSALQADRLRRTAAKRCEILDASLSAFLEIRRGELS